MLKDKELITKIKENGVRYVAILLLLTGLISLVLTFYPILKSYIDYILFPPNTDIAVEIVKDDKDITKNISKDTDTVLLDPNFGIYIPKIKANAPVLQDVNPNDEDEYINALYKGVAHAKGTSTPNREGNVFLFAHSAVNFYEQRRFNIYFYLLGELKKDDPVYISYQGEIYTYKVLEIRKVDPSETKYLGKYMDEDTLTIMTCWPAGTDFKRLIVTAVRE
jgi:LPXTG-site transpeptidase (sortase) family protein